MHCRSRVATLLVSVCCLGVCPGASSGRDGLPRYGAAVHVYDGDTLTVRLGRDTHKCRLLGIDAPELSYARLWTEMDKVSKYTALDARRELHDARNVFRKWAKAMAAHGTHARDVLSELVKGNDIRLQYDGHEPPKDKYGRLLVYVSVGETDVSAELIRRGLVVADTRFSCDRLANYVKLWRAAQARRVGMWGQASAEVPEAAHEAGKPARAGNSPVELWGSRNSDKYHLPTCRWAKRISPRNLRKFGSLREARDAGYKPCKTCRPPAE